ncbi:MAG: histidinol-phosphate transaminase [Chloroflexota bacterium]|nr:histidinol-phosphate transaminase [Chloroflexota bacterium]
MRKVRAERELARRVRPELLALTGYEPIEPVDVLAEELGIPADQILKLDGNENPYGPSPRVRQALAEFDLYHIYPDPEQRRVRQALAEYLGLDMEQIVVGSGSDELLELVARLFISPGDAVVNCQPTFGMYPFVTQIWGGRVVEVPRRADFSLDLPAVREAARDAKLIFLASPNNPTGNALPPAELDALLATGVLVVVDEAYAEFSGQSFVGLVPQHDNLIVVRTFSKWAGLAGLRAGYGAFPQGVAELIHKIKLPYNLNVAAQVAVLASLEDRETLQERVQAIVHERERLAQALGRLSFLQPFPSQANFILCRVKGIDARQVWHRLRQQGIFVRYFDTRSVTDCIRITVGKPEHTDRLVAALRQIGEGSGS